MSKPNIRIIDYGMGNLWSVLSALRYLGFHPLVTDDPDQIFNADVLILPGVGSFRKAMDSLKNKAIDQAIVDTVKNKGTKILGICLGMQLMANSSTEDGFTLGLGLIAGKVDKFTISETGGNKIPHIGFDLVYGKSDAILFKGFKTATDFYFVHSYRIVPDKWYGNFATCNYGIDFLAAYEHGNIFATQFHPEKSQKNGLILLENFLSA